MQDIVILPIVDTIFLQWTAFELPESRQLKMDRNILANGLYRFLCILPKKHAINQPVIYGSGLCLGVRIMWEKPIKTVDCIHQNMHRMLKTPNCNYTFCGRSKSRPSLQFSSLRVVAFPHSSFSQVASTWAG